jgi:hypothetical protein
MTESRAQGADQPAAVLLTTAELQQHIPHR